MLIVTPLYLSLVTFLYLYLSVRVVRTRSAVSIGLHGHEHPVLGRIIRAHANFIEYTPLVILLMMGCEFMRGSHIILHLAGIALILGRVLHVYSITVVEPQELEKGNVAAAFRFRKIAMIITFTLLFALALWLFAMVLQVYSRRF